MKKFIAVVLFFWALNACKQQPELYYYKGYIDKKFLEFVSDIPKGSTLLLSSTGGKSGIGVVIMEKVYAKKLHLLIDGEFGNCYSGCAEYVLPASMSVQFKNQPLVGYHRNPQIALHVLEQHNAVYIEDGVLHNVVNLCVELIEQKEITENILQIQNLNPKFWEHTLDRIEFENLSMTLINGKCPSLDYSYKHELWFPTSHQFRELLGLNFTGELCSDYSKCYESKIDRLWDEGVSMVVGDTVYNH